MIRSHFTGAVSEQGDFQRQFPKDGIRRVIAYYSLTLFWMFVGTALSKL